MNCSPKKNTKLCVITPAHWAAFMGGAQYQAKCIVDELSKTGRYEIEYFANTTEPSFQDDGCTIRQVGGSVPRIGYTAHAIQLYRMLNEFQPDVVYQRVACGYSGVAALYAKRNHAKMIWHVAHDGDVSPGKLEYGRNPIRQHLELASVEYAIRNASAIVTQTNVQAELLRKNYGRVADAIMPNFHPLPTSACNKDSHFTVVWIANFKRWKNPDAFITLAEHFQDRDDLQFIMVGAPPPAKSDLDWYANLLGRIDHLPNLKYLGAQNQEAVNELLAKSHLFVNTSLHEGFANTFIQAWLREVPVISLHVNPDGVFDSGEIGVCAETEEVMTETVSQLIEHPLRRNEMGRNAANYARQWHSANNVTILDRIFTS